MCRKYHKRKQYKNASACAMVQKQLLDIMRAEYQTFYGISSINEGDIRKFTTNVIPTHRENNTPYTRYITL